MVSQDYKILLVEDEDHMITTMELLLGGRYALRAARSVAEARAMLEAAWPDLLLLDLGLPDESGTVLLGEIRQKGPPLDVLVITASKDVGAAVEVMKLGAIDHIQKPFEREDLLLRVQQAHERWRLEDEVRRLRTELYDPFRFGTIIAESPQLVSVLALARKMAESEATVLITGESGTGKELIARAIHCDGARGRGPFVAVNCAQFTGTLLGSELFGHEKGAFTGATGLHLGRFELADGGTLLLDEVGNTSLEMQAQILRAVETKQFERVGGQETIEVDVRVIAATNADLEDAMIKGSFREDLYYRLNVICIQVPPLREHKQDIPPLCQHFLAKLCAKTGRRFHGITPEAMSIFMAYDWRGNVRELQNMLEMAVALEDGDWITTRYLATRMLMCSAVAAEPTAKPKSALEMAVQNFERNFLMEQLRVHGWNHRETARSLGVHRNTIENKIKKLCIRKEP